MIRIIADNKISHVVELFSNLGELTVLPAEKITAEYLQKADALLVRSVTRVDAALLSNTPIRFVGTASAGYDHLDIAYLKKKHIHCAIAAGCNATAVAEYVVSSIAGLQQQNYLMPSFKAGIIGVGHVGSRVVALLKTIGVEVCLYDPLRDAMESEFVSATLDELIQCDIICLHVPLTQSVNSRFPTYHLLNNKSLVKIKKNAILLNAARGAVLDNHAALQNSQLKFCLDVWEREPHLNLQLLNNAVIASPHVAGYSKQAKLKASQMLLVEFLDFFSLGRSKISDIINETQVLNSAKYTTWQDAVLAVYDPLRETQYFKDNMLKCKHNVASCFLKLRREYPLRNEFSDIKLQGVSEKIKLQLLRLGFKVS